MTREMKNSGIEWIGDIPSEWKIRKIKYILHERNEKNNPIKSDNILSLTASQGVIPYAEKEGGGNKPKEDLSAYKLAYPNDIVMNSMNILSGSVGLSKYFGCVSPVYYMFYSDNENINIKYFHYIFQTSVFQKSLMGLGNGILIKETENGKLNTIRMRIPLEKLNGLLLPIPDKEEQKQIVDSLEHIIPQIDKIISATKASIENYKEYKQSVITEAVTKGLDKNVPMKDSGIEWIGKIPCEWKVTKLKNVSENVTDGAHISPETDNGVYDFISTANLDNGQIDFDNCLKTSVNSYKYLVNTGCKPQINDVLISKDGTVGKTIVIDFQHDFVVASSLVIIRPATEIICPYYLNYNLQSKFVQDTLLMLMHGAGLKRVSVEKNENLPVVVPPIEEQTKIVEYLNYRCTEIDTLILQKEKLITNLEEYKKSLIYEYVTGKKAVE